MMDEETPASVLLPCARLPVFIAFETLERQRKGGCRTDPPDVWPDVCDWDRNDTILRSDLLKLTKSRWFFINLVRMFWLGGIAGLEPSLSIACCACPRPHHSIAQFQCYGRILSESLTCPIDWTRSPPPTHALWPLCGSCHKHARHYT